jgi:basic amino acid/polyamine antiporter, APA family
MTTLVRTLRLRDILLLFIGSVIGSGIFLTPGLILKQVNGSVGLAMLVWVAGGVMSLLGALTYAELAAANPEAGGLYCFIRDGFGRLPAFLYGWCLFLVISSATIAALARAFARYLGEVISLNTWQANAAALLMIVVVTVVNVRGTRQSSDLQNWTTLIKGGLVVVLSLVLLALGKHGGEIAMASRTSLRGVELFSSFSLAMIAVLWAYEGWQFGTYSAGEVVEPQRVFPRAFLLGSLVLIGLYVFAVLGYLVALGPARAAESEAIAASAVNAVLGPWAGKLVALTILLSVFSATNSVVLTAPRVFYAMAKDNLFFRTLAEV